MTTSNDHPSTAAEAVTALARGAAADLVKPEAIEPRGIAEAVARIRAWRQALLTISTIAQAQVMASCWTLQRYHADRQQFAALLARELPDLDPDRAWAMAETWAVAREQRSVRELAATDPDAAMRFVSDLSAEIGQERLVGLDEDDQEVARVLSAPPRARRAQLRALVRRTRGAEPAQVGASASSGGGGAADPEAEAQTLDLEPAGEPDTGRRIWQQGEIDDLRRIEARLRNASSRIAEGPGGWSSDRVQAMLRLCDAVVGHADRICEAVDPRGSGRLERE